MSCCFLDILLPYYLPSFFCNWHGRWRSMQENDLLINRSFSCMLLHLPCNTVSSLVLYMFIKKEENLRLVIYKIEIVCAQGHAQYCAQWAPKVILGAQFFSVLDGWALTNPITKPKFLGVWPVVRKGSLFPPILFYPTPINLPSHPFFQHLSTGTLFQADIFF